MATARRNLDEALRSVMGLQTLPEHAREGAEERAWEQLRKALREARTQPSALSCASDDEAAAALRFLAARATKRRVLRAKVAEGLQVLFGDAGWLRVARGDAELLAALESVLPVPERALPALAGPGPEPQAPALEDPALRQELRGALELLAKALESLRKLDWAFPPESSQNTDRDGAVDAFRNLFLGISRLSVAARRAGTDRARKGQIALALEAHSADWPGMLRFLADLQRHRRVFSSQIASVVVKLTELSPVFEGALEEAPEGELFGTSAAAAATAAVGTAPEAAAAAAGGAPGASPPAAALSERARAERAVFEGSRVEALYEGRWYGGTVVAVPAEDPEGRWIVQCDTDEPGVLTYAKSVSSRVEAFYEGEWYRGSVVSVPSEDPEGRWAVQCDADPPGTVTYTASVRLAAAEAGPAEKAARDPEAEPEHKTAEAPRCSGPDATATPPVAAPPALQAPRAAAAGVAGPVETPLVPPSAAAPAAGFAGRCLSALARLPGSATPPPPTPVSPCRPLTPSPARTPPMPSPRASPRSVEVVEVVVPRMNSAGAVTPRAGGQGGSRRALQVTVEVLPSSPRPSEGASPASAGSAAAASPLAAGAATLPGMPRGGSVRVSPVAARAATPPGTPRGGSVRVPVSVLPPGAAGVAVHLPPRAAAPRTLEVPIAVRGPAPAARAVEVLLPAGAGGR